MARSKFLIHIGLAMAFTAITTWSAGLAYAQENGPNQASKKEVVKGKVTRDDVARYLGKVTPSEQAAASKRARQQGMLPGIAGSVAQAMKEGTDE